MNQLKNTVKSSCNELIAGKLLWEWFIYKKYGGVTYEKT